MNLNESRLRQLAVPAVLVAALLSVTAALCGCRADGPDKKTLASRSALELQDQPKARHASGSEQVIRRSALPPISELVGGGGTVRINDSTAEREVFNAKVAPNTLISIDIDGGIIVGRMRAVSGPLPKDHRYEIILDRK
ncbi:MAG TPA: hypothetical protein VIL86_00785 [Tepidisphaeraceae bacterium]